VSAGWGDDVRLADDRTPLCDGPLPFTLRGEPEEEAIEAALDWMDALADPVTDVASEHVAPLVALWTEVREGRLGCSEFICRLEEILGPGRSGAARPARPRSSASSRSSSWGSAAKPSPVIPVESGLAPI